MINYKNYLLEIKAKHEQTENQFKNYVYDFFNNWFVKLNKIDLNILIELCFFIIIRIKNLFNINSKDLFIQFTKKNNQDIKAITLLFLPFLNDDNTNIYNNLNNLSEIICTKPLRDNIFELERNVVMKEYFKYSTMGVGLFLENGKFEDDLIYKIIYNKFLSIVKTLSIINGKMYINWINVVPLTLENYKESYIYKQTATIKTQTSYDIFTNMYNYNYNGLYIGEFYNVYRNIYYDNIKKIKWVIFPFTINNKKQYLLQFINKKINVDLVIKNKSIDELPYNMKQDFINNLRSIVIQDDEYKLWLNFILFMVNNYTHRLLIFEEGSSEFKRLKKRFQINIDEEDKDNDYTSNSLQVISQIQNYQIDLFLKNINPSFLWEYLNETLTFFKNTMYYDYLIENNKVKEDFFQFGNCNLKNLYNIAKSLSHDHEWKLLPEKYDALLDYDKKRFWENYGLLNADWINIRKNLSIELGYKLSSYEYNKTLNEILDSWRVVSYEMVWEYLVKNGLLNEFIISDNITKNFKNHPEWKDAYYYVTNKKFSELDKIVLENNEEYDYFTYLQKKLKWYSFYAMDWISQINFFNHYLNHRVLFVTGATGQGKSTQVPKLLMYSVKMLDYKINGKLVCTQPRINVTKGNSEWISQELGVPIKKPNKKFGKLKTENFYLQYKYSTDNHVKNNCSHLTLKLSTDGSLFQELIKNGLLKEQIYDKKKNSFIYGNKNLYDVVIIDESHEHNVYMDLLTTMLRNSIMFNNDVKFVIMSATLEEDEPIYRRYFRFINDNLLYPIVKPSVMPNSDIETIIDRIYLDRRFHISPPGETTQYKIVEKYLETPIIDETKPNKINSDITLKKSYEIILKICNESQKGDILLFANGVQDIMASVEYLNKVIPEGNIALPYLSGINDRYKDIITNIDKTIGFIKSKKLNVYKTWSTEYIEEDVPPDTYKRAIIIATNVAEASLTLPSLRYVVETGYTKTNIYDSDIDLYTFEIEKISEASRKQRKGRVGRTAEGTVYYVYEKYSREKIQPKFKISQMNFEDTFLQLIKKEQIKNLEPILESELEELDDQNYSEDIIVPYLIDPNNYEPYKYSHDYFKKFLKNPNKSLKLHTDSNNIIEINKNSDIVKNNTLLIIKNQYDLDDIKEYTDYWNNLYFNKMSNYRYRFFKRYNTGYDVFNLFDLDGEFYLIHPYEAQIRRNILNKIISVNFKKMDRLDIKIFKNMMYKLESKMILVDINKKKYDEIKTDYSNYRVCELYNFISEIRQTLEFIDTDKEALVIMASMGYGCLNEVVAVITLIKTINSSIKNLFVKFNPKTYNDQDREIELLVDIYNNFKKRFYYFNVFKITSHEYLLKKYYSNFTNSVQTFITSYNNNKQNIPKDFNLEQWNLLVTNYNSNKIYDISCFENMLNIKCNLTDDIFNDFNKYENEITQWCTENNYQPKIILKFIEDYAKNMFDILTIQRNKDSKYSEPNIIEIMKKFSPSFIKTLETNSIYEKTIKSFIYGYPYQFCFKMTNSIFHTALGLKKIINLDTNINDAPYLFYTSFIKGTEANYERNNLPYTKNALVMSLTNKIKIEWLCSIMPLYYNTNNFKKIYIFKDDDKKVQIREHSGFNYESLINKISNSEIKILYDNVNKNEYPVLYHYIKTIKQILKN